MSSDPANFLQKQVKIHSVSAKPELNNKIGVAQSYLSDRGRYLVSLPPHISPSPIALKADNLSIPTLPEKARGKIEELSRMAMTMYNDENLRGVFRTGVSSIESKLPPNVKVQHVAGGILLLLLSMVYFIGLSKTIMLISLLLMGVVVALPDIIAGRDAKSILKNLPFRWKEAIEQNTGYKPSKRVATGILVGILVLSGKVLLTPNTPSQKQQSNLGNASYTTSRPSTPTMGSGDTSSFTVEDIYKLGYEDAQKENDYGESLPANHESIGFNDYDYDEYANYNADYMPPPAAPKKSNFGIGTIMSLFALGSSVKELGYFDGRFDFNLFVANAKNLPPLKMAFMGFMAYRVLSAFL